MASVKDQITRIRRGSTGIVSEKELEAKLKKGKPLRIKLGVDPTAPDIHLGHTVILNKLRLFQELGHTVVFIIGDFTAGIGDPSGRDSTRPPLNDAQINDNIQTYKEQVFHILDKDKTEVHYNGEWLYDLFERSNENFLPKKLLRQHTVQQLMEREDFTERRKQGQPISLLELMYPLFQGYDSVAIKADVELGGNDQLFNLLMGRQMLKDAGMEPQVVITMPLLEGLDGVKKMSKSYNNHVGLNDAPKEMFGKVMSVSDELMWKYFELLTEEDIPKLKKEHPKEVKQKLSGIITARFHGAEAATQAKSEFEKVFSKGNVPNDVQDFKLPKNGIDIVDLLLQAKLADSKKEARRLIEQGGVTIDGKKIDLGKISINAPQVIKVGKRRFRKLIPA